MVKIMKKRIISFILVLVLCFSVNSTAFASEAISTNYDGTAMSITVPDENGNDKQYIITEGSMTEIPLYAAKETKEGTIGTQALTQVATLTIGIGDGQAIFVFSPSNIGIALLTVGFTGSFTTYLSGLRYGHNTYILPVLSGSVSASSRGTGSLSGTYSVLGYNSISILEGFSW